MKHVLGSRRFLLALIAIGCLTALGLSKGQDVGLHIAAVVASVAAANAWGEKKHGGTVS